MLDDLKLINDRDPQDALGIAAREWQQLEFHADLSKDDFMPKNIVYSGMGGSALAAQLAMTWPGFNLPFEISKNYELPRYVNEDTLVIVSSYSGNTEETLSSMDEAEAKGAKIYVIGNGGQIIERAKAKNYPFVLVPDSNQPRYSVFYQLMCVVSIMRALGMVDDAQISAELSKAKELLKVEANKLIATVPAKENIAKQIATEVSGKSVVIYSGPKMFPAAYKWKISFNENAKQVAWYNTLPEFNHNEFIGWTEQPVIKPYCVIDLRSNLDNPRVQKRFEITEKLLSGKRPKPFTINLVGETHLEQMLYAVMLGDFASIYAAILTGVNPIAVDLIEKLKSELKN
jgi:glucose/mannose-6-phosphate isomerase